MKSILDRQRDLSDLALIQSFVDGQQPGNQHAKRPQIPPNLPPGLQERMAQMTPGQQNVYLRTLYRRALANRQAKINGKSLPAQTTISQPSQGGPIHEPGIVTYGGSGQSSYRTTGITWDLSSFQESQGHNHVPKDYQMQQILLVEKLKKLQLAEDQISDTSSEKIKETDRMPFTLSPSMTNASSVVNQPLRTLGGNLGAIEGMAYTQSWSPGSSANVNNPHRDTTTRS